MTHPSHDNHHNNPNLWAYQIRKRREEGECENGWWWPTPPALGLMMTIVRVNLINHFVGFIPCQFACNLAFRNPVFRWESCKGSVWESMKKSSRVCTQQGLAIGSRDGLTAGKLPKEAHVWSIQGSWRVMPVGALQDKTSSLARQLARDLDSWLSQVARPSRPTILFRKNWSFAFQTHTSINIPYTHVL